MTRVCVRTYAGSVPEDKRHWRDRAVRKRLFVKDRATGQMATFLTKSYDLCYRASIPDGAV